jgi:hypothetical protein
MAAKTLSSELKRVMKEFRLGQLLPTSPSGDRFLNKRSIQSRFRKKTAAARAPATVLSQCSALMTSPTQSTTVQRSVREPRARTERK